MIDKPVEPGLDATQAEKSKYAWDMAAWNDEQNAQGQPAVGVDDVPPSPGLSMPPPNAPSVGEQRPADGTETTE